MIVPTHLINFSYKDMSKLSGNISSTVEAALNLINDGKISSLDTITSDNITMTEKIFMDTYKVDSIEKGIIKGNYKFILCNMKKDLQAYDPRLKYGFLPVVYPGKNDTITTYFIDIDSIHGTADKINADNIFILITSIVTTKMNRYLEKEYGISFNVGEEEDINIEKQISEYYHREDIDLTFRSITDIEFFVNYFTAVIMNLDCILSLKYKDFDSALDAIISNVKFDDIYTIADDMPIKDYKLIYNSAISVPRSDNDDYELIKTIYSDIL